MSCKWCKLVVPFQDANGVFVHTLPNGDKKTCEAQRTREPEPLSDIERQRLYAIVDLAAEIRMTHDITLHNAMDMVRRFEEVESVRLEQRGRFIQKVLDAEKHVCTNKCAEVKAIPD